MEGQPPVAMEFRSFDFDDDGGVGGRDDDGDDADDDFNFKHAFSDFHWIFTSTAAGHVHWGGGGVSRQGQRRGGG